MSQPETQAPNRIRADFEQREVVVPGDQDWSPSPMPGVERLMLDRIGDEIARATSIVRYAPHSRFSHHVHGGGEEILVLEGSISDEHGDYPVGTYLRNPVGTAHAPFVGADGATIFVKLHQFAADDAQQIAINTKTSAWHPGVVDGLELLPLHKHGTETIALERWAPNTRISTHPHQGGEEILVLEGSLFDEHGHYPAGSWIRSPHNSSHSPFTRDDGALLYVKTGHLNEAR